MKILALDTSSDGLSVAVMDNGDLLGEYFMNGGKKNHSQKEIKKSVSSNITKTAYQPIVSLYHDEKNLSIKRE